jgi:hypothetical protein
MASVSNGNGAAAAKDERVEALREQMRFADGGRGVDAYIIPSEDPHMVRPHPSPQLLLYSMAKPGVVGECGWRICAQPCWWRNWVQFVCL